MTLLPNVMHGVMHDIITESRANYYAKYLIQGVMQNIIHHTIKKCHINCHAKYLYWVSYRMLGMTLL